MNQYLLEKHYYDVHFHKPQLLDVMPNPIKQFVNHLKHLLIMFLEEILGIQSNEEKFYLPVRLNAKAFTQPLCPSSV